MCSLASFPFFFSLFFVAGSMGCIVDTSLIALGPGTFQERSGNLRKNEGLPANSMPFHFVSWTCVLGNLSSSWASPPMQPSATRYQREANLTWQDEFDGVELDAAAAAEAGEGFMGLEYWWQHEEVSRRKSRVGSEALGWNFKTEIMS